ncbi:MAG: ubiquitin-like domain-containing protein [Promethearchaeia archaeon]
MNFNKISLDLIFLDEKSSYMPDNEKQKSGNKYKFRMMGIPPPRDIKLIELDPDWVVAKIKRIVQHEYQLYPFFEIHLVFNQKILDDKITFSKLSIRPFKDMISIVPLMAGCAEQTHNILLIELLKKILMCRGREVFEFLHNIKDNINSDPLFKFFFHESFNRFFYKVEELIKKFYKISLDKNFKIDELNWKRAYLGIKDFKNIINDLTEEIYKNYNKYDKKPEIKKEILRILLKLLSFREIGGNSENKVADQIIEIFSMISPNEAIVLLNSFEFEIINFFHDNQINIDYKLKMFHVFKKALIESKINVLIDLAEQYINDQSIDMQKTIIESFLSLPAEKIHQIREILLSLFERIENDNIKEILTEILIKGGLLCGNPKCGKLINKSRKFEDIIFCEKCRKTYCEKCLNENFSISKCSLCSKYLCSEHYKTVNLKNVDLPLCEYCIDEGKYYDGQIICNRCLSYIKTCKNNNCQINVCELHSKECTFCEDIYCNKCAKQFLFEPEEEHCEHCDLICKECYEKKSYICKICDKEGNPYRGCRECIYFCDDCNIPLCEEHVNYSIRTGHHYCDACLESWKEYAWEMYNSE